MLESNGPGSNTENVRVKEVGGDGLPKRDQIVKGVNKRGEKRSGVARIGTFGGAATAALRNREKSNRGNPKTTHPSGNGREKERRYSQGTQKVRPLVSFEGGQSWRGIAQWQLVQNEINR